jgi:hypothetical protein
MTKAMTLRLDETQAALLAAVANVDNVSMQEVIRTAIDEHIDARRRDTEFRARLQASIERNRNILEKLAQ